MLVIIVSILGTASVPGPGLGVTCISSCPSYYYNDMQMDNCQT